VVVSCGDECGSSGDGRIVLLLLVVVVFVRLERNGGGIGSLLDGLLGLCWVMIVALFYVSLSFFV
jgi:hypothetical protein